MRKVSSEKGAFIPKWMNLHAHCNCWQFKNCLKSATQVVVKGGDVKQAPDYYRFIVLALNLAIPLVKKYEITCLSS